MLPLPVGAALACEGAGAGVGAGAGGGATGEGGGIAACTGTSTTFSESRLSSSWICFDPPCFFCSGRYIYLYPKNNAAASNNKNNKIHAHVRSGCFSGGDQGCL